MTQIDLFSQLASLTNECVIGCDFEQDRFLYVSQSDHRLLPASSYASLSESFAQMKAYIHPDDQHWVEQIFSVMKEKWQDPDLDLAQVDHFAWLLRVKCKFKQIREYVMLYVKFKPVVKNGQLCAGLFSITFSIQHEQNYHLSLHYINREDVEIYCFPGREWKRHQQMTLGKQQKSVLMLAQMGYSSKAIAERMFLSTKRIDKIKSMIYETLQVNTIEQAIQAAINKGVL